MEVGMPNNANRATWSVTLLGAGCAALMAFSGVARSDEPAEVSEAERAARRAQTKQILDAMKVYPTSDREGARAKRIDDPVLRYTDATRRQSDASLWIWGATGRPAAIVA